MLVGFGTKVPVSLKVADASQSMLDVLAPTLRPGSQKPIAGSAQSGVLLSRRVWREYVNGATPSTGQTIEIAGRQRRIIGVSAEEFWPVPGNMDIIVLENDTEISTSSGNALGFMLAPGIGRAAYRSDPDHPYVLASGPGERVIRYECATLAQRRIRPSFLFLLALVLACMALPATTPLALGEYSAGKPRRKATLRLRRLAFLFGKTILVIGTACFSSLTLAYAESAELSPSAEYLQLLTAFFGLLFALRWVIRDQRERCPECLCLLTRPAHVGHASRIFLEWHGTEMLCSNGHGLLYIPEHPTSWFGIQRWQSLDPSWAGLFSH